MGIIPTIYSNSLVKEKEENVYAIILLHMYIYKQTEREMGKGEADRVIQSQDQQNLKEKKSGESE